MGRVRCARKTRYYYWIIIIIITIITEYIIIHDKVLGRALINIASISVFRYRTDVWKINTFSAKRRVYVCNTTRARYNNESGFRRSDV